MKHKKYISQIVKSIPRQTIVDEPLITDIDFDTLVDTISNSTIYGILEKKHAHRKDVIRFYYYALPGTDVEMICRATIIFRADTKLYYLQLSWRHYDGRLKHELIFISSRKIRISKFLFKNDYFQIDFYTRNQFFKKWSKTLYFDLTEMYLGYKHSELEQI